jgi:hypothetical protein
MQLRVLLAVPALALLACTGAGTGVAAPTNTATAPARAGTARATTAFADWPTYHGNLQRTGYAATMPAASGAPRVVRTYTLDDRVYAAPLVIGGKIIAATENDTVYALRGGQVLWRRHLGSPAAQSELPCGNIFPLGITGTPAYSNGLVYVAAELGGPPRHVLYAIRLGTGTVAWHKSLDLPGVASTAMQERGALLVAGGRVWVPFGGLAGDCGDYKGRVVGVRLDGSGAAIAYTVPTAREAGIWTPPGPSFGGHYLFVSVGNGAATAPPWDHSDSILRIDTNAHLYQAFAPTTWAEDNAVDADLGSQGPALVGNWVFIDGKRGVAYVLDRANLGGIGGQVSSMTLCTSYGGTAVVGSTVYVPCTDGVRAVRIDSTGRLHLLWHADSAVSGSPIVGGGRVWALDPGAGVLHALNPSTGADEGSASVGSVSRFATPAAYGTLLYVPTLRGIKVVATS